MQRRRGGERVVCEELLIRGEAPADIAAIRAVNEAAFGQRFEADLVDALRGEAHPFISLVAARNGEIVGHICFSPVTVGDDQQSGAYLGLGPMAVLPAAQNAGIGSRLVMAGLDECRRRRGALVVVVGHPAFYPRFGFQPASRLGLTCEYDVPDDVFMALRLEEAPRLEDAMRPTGRVRYHAAFGRA
jgi:putative acetyltransferase